MSDDLVRSLRGQNGGWASDEALEAANRIEELQAELAEQVKWVQTLADDLIATEKREARLKSKLEKAVDVDMVEQAISDVLSEGGTYRDAAEYVARTTLAELKGDDT